MKPSAAASAQVPRVMARQAAGGGEMAGTTARGTLWRWLRALCNRRRWQSACHSDDRNQAAA